MSRTTTATAKVLLEMAITFVMLVAIIFLAFFCIGLVSFVIMFALAAFTV